MRNPCWSFWSGCAVNFLVARRGIRYQVDVLIQLDLALLYASSQTSSIPISTVPDSLPTIVLPRSSSAPTKLLLQVVRIKSRPSSTFFLPQHTLWETVWCVIMTLPAYGNPSLLQGPNADYPMCPTCFPLQPVGSAQLCFTVLDLGRDWR